MKKLIVLLVFVVSASGFMSVNAGAGDIKHRFVATDESGGQLIYVDEFNPANDWTIPLKGNRDIHVTDKGTVLVTVPDGYREYDLEGGKLIKEVKAGSRIFSMLRLGNGHTILASQNEIFELDGNDKQIKKYPVKPGKFFRILRMSKNGNFLYTGSATTVKEMSPEGKTVRELEVSKITPDCKKPYLIEELGDGKFFVSAGYGGEVHLVDKDWKLVKTYGVKDFDIHFASDVQQLKNGNVVLLNWTGHRRKDSEKAPQAIEFDKDGKVVWTWHDPKRAGSLHGIVVIEDKKTPGSCKSKNKLDVYLLIGQSNMAGRAKYGEEDSGVIDRTWLLNDNDKWEAAKNPFNRYSTIRKGLGMQKMNPGYSFARFMTAANKDVSIGLVVNAKGGSNIDIWKKGTRFYNEALRRTKIAQKSGVLKGILWHQGESNAKDSEYLGKLKTLVQDFRADLGISDLPFVAGQVNNVKLVNDQIARLPEVLKFTGFTSSEGLTTMDRWHFDTKSMKLLGERYAREILRIQSQQKPAAEKPNIVLIFSDDLSYRDLSSYGQKNYSTPNLDKLAFSGMRFVNAFCGSSECAPSRGSLMTGMHMGHCRIRKNRSVRGQDHLLDEDITIAEVLKKGGYATGFIGKWGIGLPGTEGTPDKQGFDLAYGYYDQLRAHTFFPYYMMRNGKAEAIEGNYGFDMKRRYSHSRDKSGRYDNKYDDKGRLVVEELKEPAKAVYSEDMFRREAVNFIKGNRDKPFFLYYATQLPHGPCIVPDISKFKDKPWDQKHKEWAAMVEYMDGSVGMIVKALEETGQMENTLILFAGDNGYSQWGYFGRKVHEDDPVFKNKGPWPMGKFTSTHEGGVRVPFFAYWRGKIKAKESKHMCALYDILATAADLAGVDAPKTDGISMVPTLLGNDGMQKKHKYLYWENGGRSTHAQSVRMGRWWAYRSHPLKPVELYDVSGDIECENDLAAENPLVIKNVLQIFKEAHVDSQWYNNPGDSQAVLNAKKAKAAGQMQVPVRGNSRYKGRSHEG